MRRAPFNLAPVGFFDGGRIVSAISPWMWLVGFSGLGTLLVWRFRDSGFHFQRLAAAEHQEGQNQDGPGQNNPSAHHIVSRARAGQIWSYSAPSNVP